MGTWGGGECTGVGELGRLLTGKTQKDHFGFIHVRFSCLYPQTSTSTANHSVFPYLNLLSFPPSVFMLSVLFSSLFLSLV